MIHLRTTGTNQENLIRCSNTKFYWDCTTAFNGTESSFNLLSHVTVHTIHGRIIRIDPGEIVNYNSLAIAVVKTK